MRVLAGLALAFMATAAIAQEPVRVVAFGTSLTAGQEWPAQVAAALADCGVEVEVFAQAGANSDWAVANVTRVVAMEPAAVLIEFAMNDASLLHGISFERSRANIGAIVATLKDAGIAPVLMTTNPSHGLRGMSRPMLGDYYRLYREIAGEDGVALVDAEAAWVARDLGADIPDGVHPTEQAAVATVVPAVMATLRPLLCP